MKCACDKNPIRDNLVKLANFILRRLVSLIKVDGTTYSKPTELLRRFRSRSIDRSLPLGPSVTMTSRERKGTFPIFTATLQSCTVTDKVSVAATYSCMHASDQAEFLAPQAQSNFLGPGSVNLNCSRHIRVACHAPTDVWKTLSWTIQRQRRHSKRPDATVHD